MAKKTKGKQEGKPCPVCHYYKSSGIGANYYPYKMNRAYVKEGNKLVAIGWYCKRCNRFIGDKPVIKYP